MKKLVVALALASVSLTGCKTMLSTIESPAPLQKVVIDDRAVRWGFQTLEAMASLADAGIQAKWLIPGSPKALAVANALEQCKHWLNVASAAQKAGSAADYAKAWDEASKAIAGVKAALRKEAFYLNHDKKVQVSEMVLRLRASA
jgi:hypothetical protein